MKFDAILLRDELVFAFHYNYEENVVTCYTNAPVLLRKTQLPINSKSTQRTELDGYVAPTPSKLIGGWPGTASLSMIWMDACIERLEKWGFRSAVPGEHIAFPGFETLLDTQQPATPEVAEARKLRA